MFDEAFGFELISDSSHSYFFRLSPLGSLQRHIDTCGKKAEEGGNDQPRALRRLKNEEVRHGREGSRLNEIHGKRGEEKDPCANLGHALQRCIFPAQNNDDREHRKNECDSRQGNVQPYILDEKIIKDGGCCNEPSCLANGALKQGRDQDVPYGPPLPGSSVSVQHAPSRGMGESEGHLKTVILKNVSNGYAPEQGIGETSTGCRSRDQMTGSDAGHHEDHARPEVPHEPSQGHFRKHQAVHRFLIF